MPLLVVYHWHAYCLAPKESRKLPSWSQVATLGSTVVWPSELPYHGAVGFGNGLLKRQQSQESSDALCIQFVAARLQILWVELGTICPFHTLLKQHSDGARCTRNTGMQQNALQS